MVAPMAMRISALALVLCLVPRATGVSLAPQDDGGLPLVEQILTDTSTSDLLYLCELRRESELILNSVGGLMRH